MFGSLKNLFKAGPKRVNIDSRFTKLNRVGQGSMSQVWKAIDKETGRVVCLKILDRAKTAAALARASLKNRPPEGEIALKLQHPHIVKTYEFGNTTKGDQFLSMEFVEGTGLDLLISTRSPILNGRRIEILCQAGEALAYFHDSGFIYRDFCPKNIMLTQQEYRVKLIDFGLAVPNTPEFRKPGNRTGTLNYMAPELIKRTSTDTRIDIFSFAVTAYEMLCFRLPYDPADSLDKILPRINQDPLDPRAANPRIDDELAEILLRGLARSPAARWKSMHHFVNALEGLPKKDY